MKSVILFCLLLTSSAGYAAETVLPAPKDFAYGMNLPIDGKSALYTLDLPDEIYRKVVRTDLGDIRIFNGQGETVPQTLKQPVAAKVERPPSAPLPIFPLKASANEGTTGTSLRIEKGKDGEIISFRTNGTENSEMIVDAYLLDAREIREPLAGFELERDAEGDEGIRKVTVEGSRNLEHWTPLVRNAVIVSLRHDGYDLDRRRVSFTAATYPYYRFTPTDSRRDLKLTSARGVFPRTGNEHPRRWARVVSVHSPESPDDYLFESGGQMPVDRVRITPPQTNTFVSITLSSRPSEKAPWRQRQNSLLYNLQIEGETVATPDLSFPAVSDRYWRLTVNPNGGGFGEGLPQIDIGWKPHTLLFVARGGGPFTLAYGNALFSPPSGSPPLLIPPAGSNGKPAAITVIPDGAIVLGGPQRLLVPPPPCRGGHTSSGRFS